MIPKRIIEKAIEGGWKPRGRQEINEVYTNRSGTRNVYLRGITKDGGFLLQLPRSEIALDPLFWQALGKALGWKKQPYLCEGCQTIGELERNHMSFCPVKMRHGDWDDEAHRFYDLILTDKGFAPMGEASPIEKFWEDILPTP